MTEKVKDILRQYSIDSDGEVVEDQCLSEVLLYMGQDMMQIPAKTNSDYDEYYFIKRFTMDDGTQHYLKYKYAKSHYDGHLDNYKFDEVVTLVEPMLISQTFYIDKDEQ